MPRYIDADALMKELCDFVRPSNNSDFAPVPNWNDAVSLVESAPTADVRENVQALWINELSGTFECSNCGIWHSKSRFCPNCGAVMGNGRTKRRDNG